MHLQCQAIYALSFCSPCSILYSVLVPVCIHQISLSVPFKCWVQPLIYPAYSSSDLVIQACGWRSVTIKRSAIAHLSHLFAVHSLLHHLSSDTRAALAFVMGGIIRLSVIFSFPSAQHTNLNPTLPEAILCRSPMFDQLEAKILVLQLAKGQIRRLWCH